MKPINEMLNRCLLEILRPVVTYTYINRNKKAISILYQTNTPLPQLISFPNTPVKPRSITIRCIDVKLFFKIKLLKIVYLYAAKKILCF